MVNKNTISEPSNIEGKSVIDKIFKEMDEKGLISPSHRGDSYMYLTMLFGVGYDKGRASLGGKAKKPVVLLNKQGERIREFESAYEAARVMDLQRSKVAAVAQGTRKSTKGHIFRYL